MSQYPASPDEILEEFIRDYQELFKEELISILLYGSAAVGHYVAKRSDINFMIVVTPSAITTMGRALPLIKKWRKRAVAVPMFVTEEYIDSSLDSFPLEFHNLKASHRAVYGKDVLAALTIANDLLRLQCESQIKGKLLHLLGDFLATEGDGRKMQELIRNSLPAFANVFKGLLSLKGETSPLRREEIFLRTAEIYSLDRALLEKVLAAGQTEARMSEAAYIELLEKYIAEIRKLALTIDQIK